MYNICEQYFYLDQRKSNRHPVLSQVRLTDVFDVSHVNINGVMINAMSFDILIVDSEGNPRAVFEADGPSHSLSTQITRDALKDEIAKSAGIPVFRVLVEGLQTNMGIVRAQTDIADFHSELEYPVSNGKYVQYTEQNFPKQHRLIEAADIELCLIKANWKFPNGWEFATDYELR